jgi:melanoma-associated antigen
VESEEERPQNTQRNRRRAPPSDDDSEDQDGDEEMPDADADAEPNTQDQLVKKLVRYALACEYQRLPIRRTGITEKVIGKQRGNNFRKIFGATQDQLRTKFGMELMELPSREKVTMKEKRGWSYPCWSGVISDYE